MIENKDPNVYGKNDYTPRIRLEQDDNSTGLPVPATGITDLDVWIAATKGGGPIHATLKVRATELSQVPGTYRATINGQDIWLQMFAIAQPYVDGEDVWIAAENVAGNVSGWERVKCYARRSIR